MMDTAFTNLQRREEVLSALPPPEGVVLQCYRHEVRATTAGRRSLLSPGKRLLDPTTFTRVGIQMLSTCATHGRSLLSLQKPDSPSWERRPLHARLLRHNGRLRAAEQRKALLSRCSLTDKVHETMDVFSAMDAVFQQREARRCQS